ncbi:hypothetical protein F4810DRAFT_667140 [Camillea tinctor]|nr:hypothetical protein F4810DRAFT_667140 [Camillea tinctor]
MTHVCKMKSSTQVSTTTLHWTLNNISGAPFHDQTSHHPTHMKDDIQPETRGVVYQKKGDKNGAITQTHRRNNMFSNHHQYVSYEQRSPEYTRGQSIRAPNNPRHKDINYSHDATAQRGKPTTETQLKHNELLSIPRPRTTHYSEEAVPNTVCTRRMVSGMDIPASNTDILNQLDELSWLADSTVIIRNQEKNPKKPQGSAQQQPRLTFAKQQVKRAPATQDSQGRSTSLLTRELREEGPSSHLFDEQSTRLILSWQYMESTEHKLDMEDLLYEAHKAKTVFEPCMRGAESWGKPGEKAWELDDRLEDWIWNM